MPSLRGNRDTLANSVCTLICGLFFVVGGTIVCYLMIHMMYYILTHPDELFHIDFGLIGAESIVSRLFILFALLFFGLLGILFIILGMGLFASSCENILFIYNYRAPLSSRSNKITLSKKIHNLTHISNTHDIPLYIIIFLSLIHAFRKACASRGFQRGHFTFYLAQIKTLPQTPPPRSLNLFNI